MWQKESRNYTASGVLQTPMDYKKRKENNMDEKMNEKLKEIYDSLTDEQKEKAKACKTPEELMAFAGEEDIELPEELLETVAGGGWFSDIFGQDGDGWPWKKC